MNFHRALVIASWRTPLQELEIRAAAPLRGGRGDDFFRDGSDVNQDATKPERDGQPDS